MPNVYGYETGATTSGYESNGTDLDSIFFVKDSSKSISTEYKVGGATSYGRYIERVKSSGDTTKDTGYKINGADLNSIYIRRDDIVTPGHSGLPAIGSMESGGYIDKGWYEKRLYGDHGQNHYNTKGNGGGNGSYFRITVKHDPGMHFLTGFISGGSGGTESQWWTGDGGDGGRANYLMVSTNSSGNNSLDIYHAQHLTPGMGDARLLGIAGGGGGQGGVATRTNTDGNPGGDGGDAGEGWGSSSSHGDFRYKPGSSGGWIKYGGSDVVNSGTARGGHRPGTTAVRQRYAMTMHSNLGVQEYIGASAGNTPVGANAGAYNGTGYQYYYRGGGGGGGSGYGGGASGAPGVHGNGYSRSSGGGGGGSSAYRYQNLPPGIIELSIGSLVAYGTHNGDATVAIHSTHDGRNNGL